MKIVINKCFGGFGLSEEAWNLYRKWAATPKKFEYQIPRNDPALVRVVEKLKDKAAQHGMAELKIVKIPDDVDWAIREHDGWEFVVDTQRVWE